MIGERLRWLDEYIVEHLLHWRQVPYDCACGCKQIWLAAVKGCNMSVIIGCSDHAVLMFDLPAYTDHCVN